MNARRERWGRLALAAMALVLAGAALQAWRQGTLPGRERGEPPAPLPPARVVDTGPGTLFVFETEYPACGRRLSRAEPAGAARSGLGREELARRFPGWEVADFTPGRVILRRVVAGPCSRELQYRTVTLRDGRVVVLAGRPEAPGEVLLVTDVTEDRLLPADRNKLRRGVLLQSEEETWLSLEGLEE